MSLSSTLSMLRSARSADLSMDKVELKAPGRRAAFGPSD